MAFDDSWDYSLGNGGANIDVTLPAETDSMTVFVDEINQELIDQFVCMLMDKGNRVTAINARLRAAFVFLR